MKQTYKILCPIEKKEGGTYWMRLGTAFRNKDDSINLYMDAYPTKATHIQLREMTEEDLRRRDAFRTNGPTTPASPGEPLPF